MLSGSNVPVHATASYQKFEIIGTRLSETQETIYFTFHDMTMEDDAPVDMFGVVLAQGSE